MSSQVPNTKSQAIRNCEISNGKPYDLQERTAQFAHDCRAFIQVLPRTIANIEDAKQLARASGSVAANYIEADECLSKKDFVHRIKICRKEAKECRLWIRLCWVGDTLSLMDAQQHLAQEAFELMKIFNAILAKSDTR